MRDIELLKTSICAARGKSAEHVGELHCCSKSFHLNDLLIHSSFAVTFALKYESDTPAEKQVKLVTND